MTQESGTTDSAAPAAQRDSDQGHSDQVHSDQGDSLQSHSDQGHAAQGHSTAFVLVTVGFIAALIAANITAVKLAVFGPWVLPAAVIVFPISYIFGDVLTEVYGYERARRVIWLGFAANLFVVASIWVAQILPAADFWAQDESGYNMQQAYERILGFTPRILAASFVAYLIGEFTNAAVLSRLKLATQGRFLWVRTIGSTVVGQGLDSLVFITLAFGFRPEVIAAQWLFKTAYEVLATPVTYAVVRHLKALEGLDAYDRGVSLNPLKWSEGR